MAKSRDSGNRRRNSRSSTENSDNSQSNSYYTENYLMCGRGMSSVVERKSISRESALEGTNPRYGETGDNGSVSAYTQNCQRCVVAYELRRRGFDVEAQERETRGDTLPNFYIFTTRSMDGISFDNLGASRKSQVEGLIDEKMLTYGNGSRAFITMEWENGGAHTFNVERTKSGVLKSYDAQTGRSNVLSDYAARCKPTRVHIARVDNLAPSEMWLEYGVRPSSGRSRRSSNDTVWNF